MLMEASLSLTEPTRLAEDEQERERGLGEGKPSGGSRQVQRPVHTGGWSGDGGAKGGGGGSNGWCLLAQSGPELG